VNEVLGMRRKSSENWPERQAAEFSKTRKVFAGTWPIAGMGEPASAPIQPFSMLA
jgi:hypothetical protein